MEFFNNRINNNNPYNRHEIRKNVLNPIYLKSNINENKSPLLMKEKFFNIKLYHTPNKININQNQNKSGKNYIRNSLDVKDINFKDNHMFKRNTNPLEPKYNFDWQMTEINEDRKVNYINFNDIDNHPKPLYPYKYDKNLNLNTKDIPGSQYGTVSPLSKIELKYGRKLKYTKDDIDGSHPGSVIRGIKTNRNTNPLEPNYPLFKGKTYEYEKEANMIKSRYDYKSLMDYYNKNLKIHSINNDKNNKMKIKNEISVEIDKLSRNKNYLDGFGKDKRNYPREKYQKIRNNFEEFENNLYDIDS